MPSESTTNRRRAWRSRRSSSTRSGPSWKKKEKRCVPESPADQHKGDQWDFTAVDVSSRFLVSLVIGKRTRDNLRAVVSDFAEHTLAKPPALITTDDCSMYDQVLLE